LLQYGKRGVEREDLRHTGEKEKRRTLLIPLPRGGMGDIEKKSLGELRKVSHVRGCGLWRCRRPEVIKKKESWKEGWCVWKGL